eukprot:2865440-Rhodomonas_salina.2
MVKDEDRDNVDEDRDNVPGPAVIAEPDSGIEIAQGGTEVQNQYQDPHENQYEERGHEIEEVQEQQAAEAQDSAELAMEPVSVLPPHLLRLFDQTKARQLSQVPPKP